MSYQSVICDHCRVSMHSTPWNESRLRIVCDCTGSCTLESRYRVRLCWEETDSGGSFVVFCNQNNMLHWLSTATMCTGLMFSQFCFFFSFPPKELLLRCDWLVGGCVYGYCSRCHGNHTQKSFLWRFTNERNCIRASYLTPVQWK